MRLPVYKLVCLVIRLFIIIQSDFANCVNVSKFQNIKNTSHCNNLTKQILTLNITYCKIIYFIDITRNNNASGKSPLGQRL